MAIAFVQGSLPPPRKRALMAQTGHKSPPMVRRYIRSGNLFKDNAAASVGL